MNSSWVFKIQSHSLLPHSVCDWNVPLKGGVIGRATDCDWVLADPGRVISRQHAKIDLEHGQCYWSNLGANGTHVNGKPMSPSQRTLLMPGDILKLGDYSIVVEKIQQGQWHQYEPDPFDFLLPQAVQLSHIDELLNDEGSHEAAGSSSDSMGVSVMAQRMYVGSRNQAPESLAVPTEKSDLENELARVKELLRMCVGGYMQLLRARRVYKTELGGNYTSLSDKGNNPLKISKTVDDALTLLIGESSPSYLPADQALEQAFEDLLAHMQLSITQVQQVMGQVQTELNPELISEALQREGRFNLNIGPSRKARLWDLYCERYQQLGVLWS